MAQPFFSSISCASIHQPSRIERFKPPFAATFMLDVVVLDEEHLAQELVAARELDDALQDLLAVLVLRVRLAGEDEAHRAVLLLEDGLEARAVAEQELRALVRRETP